MTACTGAHIEGMQRHDSSRHCVNSGGTVAMLTRPAAGTTTGEGTAGSTGIGIAIGTLQLYAANEKVAGVVATGGHAVGGRDG